MNILTRLKPSTLALGVLLAIVQGVAHAQAYPTRPIKIVVPFPPGGGADVMARLVGARLAAWRSDRPFVRSFHKLGAIVAKLEHGRAPHEGSATRC